jgi:putative sterol carrier protein
MQFMSKPWVEALAKALQEDPKYQKKAKGFDSYYQIVCTPSPEQGMSETRACGLLLPQATETWEGIREDVDYTMTASYEIFYKIYKGQMGAVLAITSGKAKVKGNIPRMLRYTAGTNMFVAIMKTIPTEFEGNFT